MHDLWNALFGPHATADTITSLQMTTRAVLVFLLTLAMLRLAGPRAFATNTAFDLLAKIILGGVMSRAIFAASPFGGTVLAGSALVALNRLLAWASYRSPALSRLLKGEPVLLAEHGRVHPAALRAHLLTEADLRQDVRANANLADAAQAAAVRLENDGQISVVKAQPGAAPGAA